MTPTPQAIRIFHLQPGAQAREMPELPTQPPARGFHWIACTRAAFSTELPRLQGVLQVASFHPHYQFAGTEPDDAENLTNRAPFPILHLLREDSVDRAVAAYPEPDAIIERNIETVRGLGVDGWNKLLGD